MMKQTMKRNEHKPYGRTVMIRAKTAQVDGSETLQHVAPLTTLRLHRSEITAKGFTDYAAVPISLDIGF